MSTFSFVCSLKTHAAQRKCILRSGGQEDLVMRSMPRPTTAPIPLPQYTLEVKYFLSPRNTTMKYTQCCRSVVCLGFSARWIELGTHVRRSAHVPLHLQTIS